MLDFKVLSKLKKSKNLLGFSGGVDSVGLFYSLLSQDVSFDLVIVDYGLRDSSKDEVLYAKTLAQKFQKQCFVFQAPKITSNFEAKAREVRYEFFEKIIKQNNYTALILAHHLNDRLEWLLMQLSKGCGLGTLLGFDCVEKRGDYEIIRPFIHTPKRLIYEYCTTYSYRFYEDNTNQDLSYKRNEFRIKYANDLIEKYAEGIAKSFKYLEDEKSLLYPEVEIFYLGDIMFFRRVSRHLEIYWVDKIFKKMGYILSASQRKEILKNDFCCNITQNYMIGSNEFFIFISKTPQNFQAMPKFFKNIARTLKIPKNFRSKIYEYLLKNGLEINQMQSYLIKKLCF